MCTHTPSRANEWVMLCKNESWHMWMSHIIYAWDMPHIEIRLNDVTYKWVMSYTCHIGISHVAYKRVMSRMNESYHVCMSRAMNESVLSCMNESGHLCTSRVTYAWVLSHMNAPCHIWIRHVTYEWVFSHMNDIMYERVTLNMNESWYVRISQVTRIWAMLHVPASCHVCMSHVIYEWVVSHMK